MNIIILIITGLIGLCLGSFVHVVISRFSPEKTTCQFLFDISFKRSCCQNCLTKLPFSSLIPVISWLTQRGKCKHCSQSINIHYLLTELVIAIYCITIIAIYDVCIWSIILIMLGLIFTILAVIDIKFLLLPNCFTYSILLFGFITAYFNFGTISFIDALIGMILGYLLLWLPATIYYLVKTKVGLGGGDIKLLSALGAWTHYTQLPMLLIIASIIGLLYFLIIYCRQDSTKKKLIIIPFGPCLLISSYGLLLF